VFLEGRFRARQAESFPSALFEAVFVAVHLEDVDVVGRPIEQGACERFRSEDLDLLGEEQIAGDQSGAAFLALANSHEEQFSAGLGERYEAEFIDDEQLGAGDLLLVMEELLLVRDSIRR
jgi:hypothetical protein